MEPDAAMPEPLGSCPGTGDLELPSDPRVGAEVEQQRIEVDAPLFWLDAHDGAVVATDFTNGVHHVVEGQASAVPHDLDNVGLLLRLDGRLWVTDFHGPEQDRIVTLDLVTGEVDDEVPVSFEFPYFWGSGIMGGKVDGTTVAWVHVSSGDIVDATVDGPVLGVQPVGDHVMVLHDDAEGGRRFTAVGVTDGDVVASGVPGQELTAGYMAALGDDCLAVAKASTSRTTLTLVEVPSGLVVAEHELPTMLDFYNFIPAGDTIWASGFNGGHARVMAVDLADGVVSTLVDWPRDGQPHLAVGAEHAWLTHGGDLVAIPVRAEE